MMTRIDKEPSSIRGNTLNIPTKKYNYSVELTFSARRGMA